MEGGTKNLCAQIPIDLHRKVREYQEQSGKSLGEYMTWLITTFYQFEEEQKMTNTETRTVAFQVPAELFEAFKDYLQRRGMKQKEFFLACIQNALAETACVGMALADALAPEGVVLALGQRGGHV